jgi:hypothetical protein
VMEFSVVVPNIFESSVWNLIYVTLLLPTVWRWHPDFWRIYKPLELMIYVYIYNRLSSLPVSQVKESDLKLRLLAFCCKLSLWRMHAHANKHTFFLQHSDRASYDLMRYLFAICSHKCSMYKKLVKYIS